jgi:hypothetical protein
MFHYTTQGTTRLGPATRGPSVGPPYPFTAQWVGTIRTMCFNIQNHCTLCTECICVSRMIHTMNSDYLPK